MIAVETDLYLGGYFTSANGIACAGIVKFNTITNTFINPFGTGLVGGDIRLIYSFGTDLYIGGTGFTSADGVPCSNIIKFNTITNTFTNPFGTGANNYVMTACSIGFDLYIGGYFTTMNGNTWNGLAKFNTVTQTLSNPFGTGTSGGIDGVRWMTVNGPLIYILGGFASVNGNAWNSIFQYNSATNTLSNPFNSAAAAFLCGMIVNQVLYLCGQFSNINGTTCQNIIAYNLNTNTWFNPFGTGINGWVVFSICAYGNILYIGGESNTTANGLAIANIVQYTISQYGIAIGNQAGFTGQSSQGIAIGSLAGSCGQGVNGIAIGVQTGQTYQQTGSVAIGSQAGNYFQGTGSIAIGYQAGYSGQGNNSVCIGTNAGITGIGSRAIALGYNAGLTSQAADSMYSIPNMVTMGASASLQYDTTTGQIGPPTSTQTLKTNVQMVTKAVTDDIHKLSPVTFNYVSSNVPSLGLIAEDVNKYYPELTPLDKSGKPYTINYELLNVLLLQRIQNLKKILDERDEILFNV
jgi:hypothetical protein